MDDDKKELEVRETKITELEKKLKLTEFRLKK